MQEENNSQDPMGEIVGLVLVLLLFGLLGWFVLGGTKLLRMNSW